MSFIDPDYDSPSEVFALLVMATMLLLFWFLTR